jgi:hypothetical protein
MKFFNALHPSLRWLASAAHIWNAVCRRDLAHIVAPMLSEGTLKEMPFPMRGSPVEICYS